MNAARSFFATSRGTHTPDSGQTSDPLTEMSDEVIVVRIRAGDIGAYRVLVERHTAMVFQLTQRFSDTPADADDLAQDIFVKAYRSLERFEGQARFSTWLYAIALNRCRDYAKNVRRKIYRLADVQVSQTPMVQSSEAPDQRLETTEQVQALRNALLHLPDPLALPFLLYYNHGFAHRTIANMLGTTEGAVKVRVHRARQALREKLNAWL